MNTFTYELIEQLDAHKGDADSELSVLGNTRDSRYYYALSPDRVNVLESFPWDREMRVLEIGAAYGVYAGLAERTAQWDITDPAEEELEVVKRRYPDLTGGAGPLVRLLKEGEARTDLYDVVVLPLCGGIRTEEDRDPEMTVREATGYVRTGGILIVVADNRDALRYAEGETPEKNALFLDPQLIGKLRRELPFGTSRVFYPLPNAAFARNIHSETRLPGAGDFKGISENFLSESYAMSNEEMLYGRLSDAGVFEQFAPSFLLILEGKGAEGDTGKLINRMPVYTRYNRNRDDAFVLKTEMFEDENGTVRSVRKTALSAAANAHVDSFLRKCSLLRKTTDPKITIPEPAIGKTGNGFSFAEFPFVSGRDLGKHLADMIRNGRAPEEEIRKMLELLTGSVTGECHNLDGLFENIMVQPAEQGGSFVLLDYEWVFDEAQDRRYVQYRILSYWYDTYKEQLYGYKDKKEYLAAFGIAPEWIGELEEKEAAFQSYVRGGGDDLAGVFRKKRMTPADVKAQEARLAEFTEWNLRLQDEIEEHKAVIRKEREVERLSQNHIRNIEKINAQREAEIIRMSAELERLRKHQSFVSRAADRAVRALDTWAPAESRKRKLIHLVKNTVRHPFAQCRLYFTPEGRDYIAGDFNIGGEFAEGGILTIPGTEDPLVSIVIPAYNQVAYTYACVRSIIANTDFEETPYEVILADDVSTDATEEIGRYIRGLVISRNSSNMGFLKNCNQAAEKARGKYIFFLNNDTKVHNGWLKSLTDLMDSDPSIGLAGSKLVYPDGRLQEAGGIIWSDASGWNYGRLDDPDKPEYNYVKDVDYISGAAIMISVSLWKEIGGFDERFAPAYCEDSDLAFEVRRHGKRVVYQPASVVTHFEGISNGTDVTGTGLKRYQVVNQQTFREKWAEELKKQSVNTGNPDPFKARDRSQHKPCVVVVDHYVPTWDQDAGSRTTYQYIRMFLRKGFNVKFVGDNFLHEEPYSSALEQMGVEILYGPEYQNNILEWFRKNSANIDFCYLNRPHIAVKYIDFLKENTDIRCIFYGHDLHYLRLLREYELSGEIRKKRESDYWKSVEFSVMEKADMVYYPSQTEIDAVHAFHPEIRARAITAYLWDEFPDISESPESYGEKRDMLFVGGFKHPPNADAVRWFGEKIWPALHEKLPGARFLIAGSGADEGILAMASEDSGIDVLGFVSDERLRELYRSCRLVVVPLRYGAGVKGKVVEAVYNGCVVVTTAVGAEGIPEAESVMKVTGGDPAGTAEQAAKAEQAFTEAVLELYGSDEKCAGMSRACGDYIRRHYSLEAAWDVIREDWQWTAEN